MTVRDDQPRDDPKCECGLLERFAADPRLPIEFDERTNEYEIVHDGVRIPMQYCFRCGGRLPESTRASLFTTPDDNEMAEIAALLKGARSIDDVVRILGPADDIHEGHFDAVGDAGTGAIPRKGRVIPWKQQLDYRKRWRSLTLIVHEHPDGSVSYMITGKQIGME